MLEDVKAENCRYACGDERHYRAIDGVFQCSGLEEIALPNTLKRVDEATFYECNYLNIVWVEDGCTADIGRKIWPCAILFSTQTKAGDQFLRDLRRLREVAIPDGVERVEDSWFRRSHIESVTFPASVRELGEEAFYDCAQLRTVRFAEGG